MHEGTTEGGGVRGGQPVKWINRVDEYWIERERGGMSGRGCEKTSEQGRLRESSVMGTSLGGKLS